MLKKINNWLDIIQQTLLPPTCILCSNPGQDTKDICMHCEKQLIKNIFCCYRCACIFDQPATRSLLCGECLQGKISFDETHAPFLYQGSIRYLISELKFHAQFKNARLLGMLMAEQLIRKAERPDYLIPMPLYKTRYRQRGFNQAQEIANTLSNKLNIPLELNGCFRHRNTPHQIDLTAIQRRKNMKNAFTAKKSLKGLHLAIVDDVMTTGTTVNELAKVLKKAGANRVDVWVCSRA